MDRNTLTKIQKLIYYGSQMDPISVLIKNAKDCYAMKDIYEKCTGISIHPLEVAILWENYSLSNNSRWLDISKADIINGLDESKLSADHFIKDLYN